VRGGDNLVWTGKRREKGRRCDADLDCRRSKY
jgi:hypothetical protein